MGTNPYAGYDLTGWSRDNFDFSFTATEGEAVMNNQVLMDTMIIITSTMAGVMALARGLNHKNPQVYSELRDEQKTVLVWHIIELTACAVLLIPYSYFVAKFFFGPIEGIQSAARTCLDLGIVFIIIYLGEICARPVTFRPIMVVHHLATMSEAILISVYPSAFQAKVGVSILYGITWEWGCFGGLLAYRLAPASPRTQTFFLVELFIYTLSRFWQIGWLLAIFITMYDTTETWVFAVQVVLCSLLSAIQFLTVHIHYSLYKKVGRNIAAGDKALEQTVSAVKDVLQRKASTVSASASLARKLSITPGGDLNPALVAQLKRGLTELSWTVPRDQFLASSVAAVVLEQELDNTPDLAEEWADVGEEEGAAADGGAPPHADVVRKRASVLRQRSHQRAARSSLSALSYTSNRSERLSQLVVRRLSAGLGDQQGDAAAAAAAAAALAAAASAPAAPSAAPPAAAAAQFGDAEGLGGGGAYNDQIVTYEEMDETGRTHVVNILRGDSAASLSSRVSQNTSGRNHLVHGSSRFEKVLTRQTTTPQLFATMRRQGTGSKLATQTSQEGGSRPAGVQFERAPSALSLGSRQVSGISLSDAIAARQNAYRINTTMQGAFNDDIAEEAEEAEVAEDVAMTFVSTRTPGQPASSPDGARDRIQSMV